MMKANPPMTKQEREKNDDLKQDQANRRAPFPIRFSDLHMLEGWAASDSTVANTIIMAALR